MAAAAAAAAADLVDADYEIRFFVLYSLFRMLPKDLVPQKFSLGQLAAHPSWLHNFTRHLNGRAGTGT